MDRALGSLDRLEHMVEERLLAIKPFRAFISLVDQGLFSIYSTAEDPPAPGDESESYARLRTGQALRAGDDVAVITLGGKPFILGGVQNTEGGAMLESPVASKSLEPSASVLTAAGTGATIDVRDGNDDFGTLVLVTGTSPGTGGLVTVTFTKAKLNDDFAVILSSGDSDAAAASTYIYVDYLSGRTTTSFTISTTTALPASRSHIWYYVVLTPLQG